jgi:hypothetical protein
MTLRAKAASLLRPKQCPAPSQVFTGRKDELDKMNSCFFGTDQSRKRKQKIFVLHGFGGAGKSQLTFKFVDHQSLPEGSPNQYVQCFILLNFQESEFTPWCRFTDVFFVDASTKETIHTDLQKIALDRIGENHNHEDAIHWLTGQQNDWLLLFDGADDKDLDLRNYFPHGPYGNILITSHNENAKFLALDSHCGVSQMNSEEATKLFLTLSRISVKDSPGAEGKIANFVKSVCVYVSGRVIIPSNPVRFCSLPHLSGFRTGPDGLDFFRGYSRYLRILRKSPRPSHVLSCHHPATISDISDTRTLRNPPRTSRIFRTLRPRPHNDCAVMSLDPQCHSIDQNLAGSFIYLECTM